jgi:hypothetical protein
LVEGRSAYALRASGVTSPPYVLCDSGGTRKSESEGEGEKRQKLSTLDARLSMLHSGKIIYNLEKT